MHAHTFEENHAVMNSTGVLDHVGERAGSSRIWAGEQTVAIVHVFPTATNALLLGKERLVFSQHQPSAMALMMCARLLLGLVRTSVNPLSTAGVVGQRCPTGRLAE